MSNVYKNLNVIAYFHVASTNYDTSLLGGKCIAEKIWIPIYLPRSPNLGGVVYAKIISGGNGLIFITYVMLFKYGS